MKKFHSLRVQLFLWYLGSSLLLIGYFLLFIHYRTVPHALEILIALLLVLSAIQFFILYHLTNQLTYLSDVMKRISGKNLEERAIRLNSQNEIGELVTSFNNLLERLDSAFKREQQFIADVAHELKTPLATMRSSFEVALNKPRDNDEYRRILREAIEETDAISSTVKNVLDLAWSESYSENKTPTKINLSSLVEDISEITQKLAESKKITVSQNILKGVFTLGFKDKLARAILNIVDNAVKYTPEGGKIEILLERNADKTFLTITDNGLGIAEKEIPHIFDRFYRGAQTDDVLGSGLGLAISKSIINLHKGDIKVKSQPKKGSTFIMIFPILS